MSFLTVCVLKLPMIQIDCVLDRIIKNNIYRKSEKIMNKNTLFNYEGYDSFKNNSNIDLQNEILQICDPDNIFAFCEFEENELNLIKKTKEKLDARNDEFSNEIIIEFVSKEVLDKFHIKLSEIKKKIQANGFKQYYYNNLKNKSIVNCNIKRSVELTKYLQGLAKEQNDLEKEYNENIVQLNEIQLKSFDDYGKMLQDFCDKKEICKTIKDIEERYNIELLKIYLSRKIAYLILHNFDKNKLPQILQSLKDSEVFKNNFAFVYEGILGVLKCGNK